MSGTGAGSPGGTPQLPRLGGTHFETAYRSYLHSRLRTTTAVLAGTTAGLLLTSLAAHYAAGGTAHADVLNPTRITLAAGLAVAAGCYYLLRRPNLSARTLGLADILLLWLVIGACTAYYAVAYRDGPFMLVPVLGLFILARAVLIPSRSVRTALVSVPAIPAILAVQLSHMDVYSVARQPFGPEWFGHILVWDHAWLLLVIGLATVASRLNFELRVRAHEAARIGQYHLEYMIGEGGMGRVYRGRHGLMQRPTAVKVIRGDLLSERHLKRFEEEVRQTSRLTHPNTVAVFDFGRTDEGIFYYVMEYLEGADLGRIVGETGPMPAGRVIQVLAQACDALSEAHGKGLVHRDVKPGNIFLCDRGGVPDVVKLMDFGLVKDVESDSGLTRVGEICGTPETLSPEAILGRPVGPGADIYALGVVGVYLLCGKMPFDAETPIAHVNCHLHAPPVPPSSRGVPVPDDLEALLLECLAKLPEARPATTALLRERLLACRDAAAWTRAEAAAWWREHGPVLLDAAPAGVLGGSAAAP